MKFELWRPKITLSSDNLPLATSTSDLYPGGTFPHERLPIDSPIISFFVLPTTPILLILAYFLSEKFILPKICRSLRIEGKSIFWKSLFALHNFALAIFSFVVWVNSWVSTFQLFFVGWFQPDAQKCPHNIRL